MMTIELLFNKKKYNANLSAPIDISLPIREGSNNPNCYWADPVKFETISSGDFVGSVEAGGNVNYQKLFITPHGNGTHTECFGHISSDKNATINQCLKQFHFIAQLISVSPDKLPGDDAVITLNSFQKNVLHENIEAVVLRSIPNAESKKSYQYSGTNPPYIDAALVDYLASKNVKHLLIDLPSVDRESDEGKLQAHRAFWRFPESPRKDCTITELIFVDNSIEDGLYLLNIQITSLEMDASPSKPVLFKLEEVL